MQCLQVGPEVKHSHPPLVRLLFIHQQCDSLQENNPAESSTAENERIYLTSSVIAQVENTNYCFGAGMSNFFPDGALRGSDG